MGFDVTPVNAEEKMKRLSQIITNLNDAEKKIEITHALVDFQMSADMTRLKFDLEITEHYKTLSKAIDKVMGWDSE